MIKNIFNIRQGFATNSSSIHSLIRLPVGSVDTTDNFRMGYGNVVSQDFKLQYFLSQLFVVFKHEDWEEMRDWVAEKYGIRFTEDEMDQIDNQSLIIRIVRTQRSHYFNDDTIYSEFYQDLIQNVVADETIGIEIASDGCDLDDTRELRIPGINFIFDGSTMIGKKDGDYWIVFSPTTGNKMRLSFTTDSPPIKSMTPELVDIKITDMCNSNCKFCYQGSTPTGLHAEPKYLKSIFESLAKLETFELVLGGGDPFEHPDFDEIILGAKSKGFSVSISTRRYDRIIEEFERIHKRAPSNVFKALSAIGISVSSLADMKHIVEDGFDRFNNIKEKTSFWTTRQQELANFKDKLKFHIVMGTVTRDQFTEMVRYAREHYIGILLLGYKSAGRGCDIQPMDYDWWIDVMKQERLYRFSIDTSMAKKYTKELAANNVDPRTYEIFEGKFSCYIDAVKQTISKDSYSDEKEVHPLCVCDNPYDYWEAKRTMENNIKELFSKF